MKELWVPVSGAIAQQKIVDTLANNVANANTVGFKKDNHVFREYMAHMDKGTEEQHLPRQEWGPQDFYRSFGAENSFVKDEGSYTDFEQGQLMQTGSPLDVALQGPGFLEVLSPHGIRFTRKGSLTLSQDGFLTNDRGDFVLSTRPLQTAPVSEDQMAELSPESRKIRFNELGGIIQINQAGKIFQNQKAVGEFSVIEFQNPHELLKEGHSLYINRDDANINPNRRTAIYQGHLEGSNVNALQEMSALIKANRHFETLQKAIKAYDALSEKSVTEIGKF
jgi:flagellar basal-body rod protein FlgF